MLQLIVNDSIVELSENTSIEIQFENPLCLSDRIPVSHSMSFEVPNTQKNLIVFGNPNRATSSVDFATQLPAELRFAEYVILSGTVAIEEVEKDIISLHFVGAVFPEHIKKHLQNQNFGRKIIGAADITTSGSSTTINTTSAQAAFSSHLNEEANKSTPNYVAATMKIDGTDFVPPEDPLRDIYSNLNQMFINGYNGGYSFSYVNPAYNPGLGQGNNGSGCGKEFAKVFLSFRVGWILNQLLSGKLVSESVFGGDLARLMLVCTYHPAYNQSVQSPVWNVNKTTGEVYVDFAEYMPDVAASDFIGEILKLVCGSLYIKGDRYEVVLNSDIITSACDVDWSDRVIGTPVISRQAADEYVVGYSDSETQDAAPSNFITVPDIINMIRRLRIAAQTAPIPEESFSIFFYITSTGQYFEAYLDTQLSDGLKLHFGFKVLSCNTGESSASEETKQNSFDMTVQGSVVKSNVVTQVLSNTEHTAKFDGYYSLRPHYYCPMIEKPTERPSALMFGIYHGLRNIYPPNDYNVKLPHPCISAAAVAPDGIKSNPVSLLWHGEDGLLAKYHMPFKNWIERDKRVINTQLLLKPIDLHKFDMRKKVHVNGVDFFVKTLNIVFKTTSIEPAEAELIEA